MRSAAHSIPFKSMGLILPLILAICVTVVNGQDCPTHSTIPQHDKINVWLDADPGQDDLLAIILAARNPRINLLGVSTSAGNSRIDKTTQNVLDILHAVDRDDIEVIQGAQYPLIGELETAEHIHGENGLDGTVLEKSPNKAITKERYLQIYNRIIAAEGKVNYVNVGGMTNLATLLLAFPELKEKIERIVLMAGAITKGNMTPAAEFNVLVDPLAASMVFNAGVPVVMVPLELTHTALITDDVFQRFLSMNNTHLGKTLEALGRKFQRNYKIWENFDYPPAHDPCAVYYLLNPSAFDCRQAQVHVDLYPHSYGRTNVNFHGKKPNLLVCDKINVDTFWSGMFEALNAIP